MAVPSEFLDSGELHQLTGYARPKQQANWLAAEKIPHQVRGARIIVCRVHARAWVEGKTQVVSSWKPDFSKSF